MNESRPYTPEGHHESAASAFGSYGGEGSANIVRTPISVEDFPKQKVLNEVKKILEGSYTGPWICYGDVPKPIREQWFREFKRNHTYPPAEESEIQRAFNSRCSVWLTGVFNEARDKNKTVKWISPVHWRDMLGQWASLKFKKKSETNKKNSSSAGCRSSPYCGGSVSQKVRAERLAQKLGRTPFATEIVKDGFQKKETKEWSGPRAQEIAEKVAAEIDRQTQDSEGGKVDENAIFFEVVSPKKGKIFGVDPFTVAALRNGSFPPTSSQQTQYVKAADFEAFKTTVLDKMDQILATRGIGPTNGSTTHSAPNITQGFMSDLHSSMFPTVPSRMTHNLHSQPVPYYPTMYTNGYVSGQQPVSLQPSMPSQVPCQFIPLQNRNSTSLDDTFLNNFLAGNEGGNQGGGE
ncbi:unnamed protein product [Cuscuta epithymum]|nr:unnamed protein product [Cuscuta epithymum]